IGGVIDCYSLGERGAEAAAIRTEDDLCHGKVGMYGRPELPGGHIPNRDAVLAGTVITRGKDTAVRTERQASQTLSLTSLVLGGRSLGGHAPHVNKRLVR